MFKVTDNIFGYEVNDENGRVLFRVFHGTDRGQGNFGKWDVVDYMSFVDEDNYPFPESAGVFDTRFRSVAKARSIYLKNKLQS